MKIPRHVKQGLYEKLDLYAKLQARASIAEKLNMYSIAQNCTEGMTPLWYEIERIKQEYNIE